MKIEVTAKAAQITERETLTVGSRGIMISVSFSPEWDSLTKTALFWDGTENEAIPVLIFSDFILLPPEMTATKALRPSVVFVGKNADGTEVFPAVECSLGNVWYGIRSGKYPPVPPSPGWIAQVEAAVAEAKKDSSEALRTAKSVEDRANNGEFNGKDFSIKKVYKSVAEMLADHGNPAVEVGDFVMIETGDPENPENSRMYVKTDKTFEFVTDLSGSMGIRGPQGFTFTPHMRKVANGVEITWTNNGGLENPPAQVVLDYQHSDEFSRLAEQVRNDAVSSDESAKASASSAALSGRQAEAAGNKAIEAKKSAEQAAQSVTDASNQVEAAKEQVRAATEQVTLAKKEVQKASEQVTLASKEVDKAKEEVVNAQNEVKNAQAEVANAAQQADRAKSEADRATEAAENAGRGYTNQVAANALTRTVTGEVIALDDVSPLEHSVGCMVERINYFNTLGVTDLPGYIENRDGKIWAKSAGQAVSNESLSELAPYLKARTSYFLKVSGSGAIGRQYIYLRGTKRIWKYNSEIDIQEDDLKNAIIFYGGDGFVEIGSIQISEISKSAYPIVPYIPDLSAVTVSRSGINIYGGEKLADDIVTVFKGTKNTDDKTITFEARNADGILIKRAFKPNTAYTFIIRGRNTGSSPQANMRFNYTDGSTQAIVFNNQDSVISYANVSDPMKTLDSISGAYFTRGTVLYYEECGLFEGKKKVEDLVPFAGSDDCTPSPSGIVEGMTSLPGAMTILSDTPGVNIEAIYNQDLMIVNQKQSDRITALENLITEKLGGM